MPPDGAAGVREREDDAVILTELHVPQAEFELATGWALKPEGACRGDVCVPLVDGCVTDGRVDVAAVAERLGMPLVTDAERGVSALGPATLGGRALATAALPDLELADLDGRSYSLASLRGTKVAIIAWAPY